MIQAQERAEQSGQHEKQNDGHKDRGGNFLEVTSRGNARFARPGPSPLRVLGNSFYIRSNVRPSSRAFLLQTLLLLFDQSERAPVQREPRLPEQPLDAGALEVSRAGAQFPQRFYLFLQLVQLLGERRRASQPYDNSARVRVRVPRHVERLA